MHIVINRISIFLRKRKEIITGAPVDNAFRNVTSICKQYSGIRCLDPDTRHSKMQGTKLQKEVMKEYLENPKKINEEAEKIYEKYKNSVS